MKPINREIRTAYANGPKVTVASVKDEPTLQQTSVSNEADGSYIENAAKLQSNTMTDEEIKVKALGQAINIAKLLSGVKVDDVIEIAAKCAKYIKG